MLPSQKSWTLKQKINLMLVLMPVNFDQPYLRISFWKSQKTVLKWLCLPDQWYLEFWLWPKNRLHTCKIELEFVRTHPIFLSNFFMFPFKNCQDVKYYFRCSSIHLAVKTCLIYEPSFIFLTLWPLVSKEHYTYAMILMWHIEGSNFYEIAI